MIGGPDISGLTSPESRLRVGELGAPLEDLPPFLRRAEHRLLIGGERPVGHELRPTKDPATGAELGIVCLAGPAEVDQAVRVARRAFTDVWSRLAPADRERLILRYADSVEAHTEELALIETLDNGMPLAAARGSVGRAVAHLRYNAGWATKISGETIAPSKPGREFFAYTLRQPVGVVAAIVPWNSPLAGAMLKISAALGAGCTVIVKPATETPLSALRLGELALDAGLPPGVVNVLPGEGAVVGQALAEHSGVAKVSFTGSTAVGQGIIHASANRIGRLTLELGGKSPDVVFDDVDVEKIVPQAAWAVFRNSGQICVAGSRLYVQAGIYDEFLERLVKFTRSLKVGNGLAQHTDVGPLITEHHTERVANHIARGVEDGARLLVGGERVKDEQRPSGQFITPAVFAEASPSMQIAREEVFGPVVVISRFETVEDAIERANDTNYGLAAGIWTENVSVAHHVAACVDAGMIWVNCYGEYDPALPFGGHKLSGYGAKSGHAAVLECTDLKTVVVKLAPPDAPL